MRLPYSSIAAILYSLASRKYELPRIGLLSDSHGRASTTRQAVNVLLEAGAQCIIHLGDVGTIDVIDELLVTPNPAGGPARTTDDIDAIAVHLVFGNVDWDRAAMSRYAQSLGLIVDDPVGKMKLDDGRELLFLHGDDAAAMAAAMDCGAAYVCHGHSHRTRDERIGKTRVINPGALFRAQSYTAALLDTDADSLVFLPVE